MTKPRYSIIPGGAVTDARLEGRDLQLLCFLGTHTDRLGWCNLNSQVAFAKELNCSRSTIQRSLGRLIDAGWVAMKSSATDDAQPYACHAYRVVMDRDEPDLDPPEDQTEVPAGEQGCPPVGTGVPSQDGHGGAHAYVGTERPSKVDQEIDQRAGEPLISKDAQQLADDCVTALGFEPQHPPIELAGLPYQTSIMLRRGYDPPRIVAAFARFAGQQPVKPLSYFVKVVETACTAPQLAAPSSENANGGSPDALRNGFVGRIGAEQNRPKRSVKEQRWSEAWDNVERGLGITRSDADRAGGDAGPPPVGGLPEPRGS